MSFILESNNDESVEEFLQRYERYYDYLDSLKHLLPDATYEFARAAWHYDHNDPRCPHDGWLEQLRVYEPSSGERSEIRSINITIRLLNAFHDGFIEIEYVSVEHYSLTYTNQFNVGGHGDWLIDEIRLSTANRIAHDIRLVNGRLSIECSEVSYLWLPFDSPTWGATT